MTLAALFAGQVALRAGIGVSDTIVDNVDEKLWDEVVVESIYRCMDQLDLGYASEKTRFNVP